MKLRLLWIVLAALLLESHAAPRGGSSKPKTPKLKATPTPNPPPPPPKVSAPPHISPQKPQPNPGDLPQLLNPGPKAHLLRPPPRYPIRPIPWVYDYHTSTSSAKPSRSSAAKPGASSHPSDPEPSDDPDAESPPSHHHSRPSNEPSDEHTGNSPPSSDPELDLDPSDEPTGNSDGSGHDPDADDPDGNSSTSSDHDSDPDNEELISEEIPNEELLARKRKRSMLDETFAHTPTSLYPAQPVSDPPAYHLSSGTGRFTS
ncbi:hypothetical protein C8J57DRAFT_1655024 [Mycena rebaudengoi]|nr:hypothetical protein C8J57DRAFT_1655024 [Mycena rebaudengoi]